MSAVFGCMWSPSPGSIRYSSAAATSRRTMLRMLMRLLALIALAVIAAALAAYLLLRGSLPSLDGTQALQDLRAPVAIERDALGIPTIRASDRLDLARAIGFLHGQDRYFQMDLLRRAGAGEFSELFGAVAVD